VRRNVLSPAVVRARVGVLPAWGAGRTPQSLSGRAQDGQRREELTRPRSSGRHRGRRGARDAMAPTRGVRGCARSTSDRPARRRGRQRRNGPRHPRPGCSRWARRGCGRSPRRSRAAGCRRRRRRAAATPPARLRGPACRAARRRAYGRRPAVGALADVAVAAGRAGGRNQHRDEAVRVKRAVDDRRQAQHRSSDATLGEADEEVLGVDPVAAVDRVLLGAHTVDAAAGEHQGPGGAHERLAAPAEPVGERPGGGQCPMTVAQ
jgi:hypothetical protein